MSKKRFKILTKNMKEGKIVAFRVILGILIFFFLIHLISHILIFGNFLNSGKYVFDFYFFNFTLDYSYDFFSSYSFISIILMSGEILLSVIFSFLLFFAFKSHKKHREVLSLKDMHAGKTTTDLDNLYEILKLKKNLSVPLIANTFKVSNEVVMEWGKILERGNLAKLSYPHMRDPEIVYLEKIKFNNSEDEDE